MLKLERDDADRSRMGLLFAYVLGAGSAAVLILIVLRRSATADPALYESLGEFRGLLDSVRHQQRELTAQASQFTQLLGRPADRGRWGELTLQNLVEAAGLRQHVDFDVQVHTADPDGTGRPDLVLRLPSGLPSRRQQGHLGRLPGSRKYRRRRAPARPAVQARA